MARGFNFAPGSRPEVEEALRADLSKARLLELGSSKNATVRHAVARRPDCPLGLMVSLAHDHSGEVRASIAANPAAQASVLAYLAGDRVVDVVWAVVRNPATPDDVVERLVGHRNADVREAAAGRLTQAGAVVEHHAEDEHTPELADAVRLTPAAGGKEPSDEADAPPVSPSPGRAWTPAPVRGFRAPSE